MVIQLCKSTSLDKKKVIMDIKKKKKEYIFIGSIWVKSISTQLISGGIPTWEKLYFFSAVQLSVVSVWFLHQ